MTVWGRLKTGACLRDSAYMTVLGKLFTLNSGEASKGSILPRRNHDLETFVSEVLHSGSPTYRELLDVEESSFDSQTQFNGAMKLL